MEKETINYEEKVVSQTDLVKKLVEDYKNAPSDEKKLKLHQETDILRHYSNAVRGDTTDRSQAAYDFARKAALNKAVKQLPDEDDG